jgi:hypothetical protein
LPGGHHAEQADSLALALRAFQRRRFPLEFGAAGRASIGFHEGAAFSVERWKFVVR